MVFFVLAMQCMSTIAVVRRETNSWSWPLFMVGYMTGLAYIAALITYQVGSFWDSDKMNIQYLIVITIILVSWFMPGRYLSAFEVFLHKDGLRHGLRMQGRSKGNRDPDLRDKPKY